MTRVNMFVDINTELVKEISKKVEMVQESNSKRARGELESDNSKKQKLDENVKAKVDDEAEMKKHMEIVSDDEVAIDAIPLATKPPIIVDCKIIKEGKMGYFQIIRADDSSRRPEEAYERVLWGDLKVMFEPNIESKKMNIKFRGGLLGSKDFMVILELILQVSVAGIKVNAAAYNC
ncbi:hypothetical protein Tco_0919351 [Tanacetum coccineum]